MPNIRNALFATLLKVQAAGSTRVKITDKERRERTAEFLDGCVTLVDSLRLSWANKKVFVRWVMKTKIGAKMVICGQQLTVPPIK